MRNVADKTCRKNQNTHMFNNPPQNHDVYNAMWKHTVELDKPQMTIWCMCFSSWIPKATNTHSLYAILIDFPLQQWLHECASVLLCYVIRPLPIMFLKVE